MTDELLQSIAAQSRLPAPAKTLEGDWLESLQREAEGDFDEGRGWLRRRAEVPAARNARARLLLRGAARRAAGARDGHAHARRHDQGRHVRPSRWRVRAVLGRRRMAHPALREDALRQRAARSALRRRGDAHGRRALPPHRARDVRLRAARSRARRRRAHVGARRGQRARRREGVRVDAARAPRGAGAHGRKPRRDAPAGDGRGPFEHGTSVLRLESPLETARRGGSQRCSPRHSPS